MGEGRSSYIIHNVGSKRREVRTIVGVLVAGIVAGFVQGLTGFGMGIVLMCVLPYLMAEITGAAAVTGLVSAVAIGVQVMLLRAHLRPRLFVPPAVFYLCGSTLAILTVSYIPRDALAIIFSIFLIGLSAFFLSGRQPELRADVPTMFLCDFVSGLCDGYFSIGGPLMVMFFLAVTDDRDEYLANLQMVFCICATFNSALRAYRGLLSAEMVPMAALTLGGILAGFGLSSLASKRIDPGLVRKLTYVLIGLSGAITLVNTLL